MREFSVIALALFLFSANSYSCDRDGMSGIVEENNLWISPDAKNISSVTEEKFNEVIDRVEAIYSSIVEAKGGELQVERNWSDGTVNAYAQRNGNVYKVAMFGGLARHQTVTADAFALVVCHELGHHIGGQPKKDSWWGGNWASNEGQADYFGTMKCLRKVFEKDNNANIMSDQEVDPYASEKCREIFPGTEEHAICVRTSMAGLSLGNLFRALSDTRTELKFTTPDRNVVTTTDHNHPAAQCRLDTYFAGSICDVDAYQDVSDTDPTVNVCARTRSYSVGVRPLCWYKP